MRYRLLDACLFSAFVSLGHQRGQTPCVVAQGHWRTRVHGTVRRFAAPDSGEQSVKVSATTTGRRRHEQSVAHGRRRRSRRDLDLQPGTEHAL